MKHLALLTLALVAFPTLASNPKALFPAGTADEPSAVFPPTPCSEPMAFWWDDSAFHVGDRTCTWSALGVTPTNGATFRIDLGVIDRERTFLEGEIALDCPRFAIGAFGPIGNRDLKTKVTLYPKRSGNMRSYFVAQGQTPDFLNLSKGLVARAGEPVSFEITGHAASSGDVWYHLYDTDGREFCTLGGTFRDPKLLFDYQYLWTDPAKKLMYVVTKNWSDTVPGDHFLRVTAKDLRSNTLGTWTKTQKLRKAFGCEQYAFDVSDLAEGFYWINVDYLDAAGKVVHTDRGRYVKPSEKMPWEGTTLGAEDTVPPPWTAPSFGADGTFRCWNREIRLGGEGLVSSVLNGGREQLAAPVAVLLNGEPLAFDVKLKDAKRSTATYRLTARGADISVDATCDFDGYVRFDLAYGAGVKSLAWTLPMRRDQVSSFNHGGFGGGGLTLLTKDRPFEFVFDESKALWLWSGDATVGFLHGLVDLKGTRVKDLAKSARAVTSSEAFTVTMTLVDTPYDGPARRTASFYLEPTPVKPKNLDLAAVTSDKIVGWTGHLCEYFEIKYPGFEVFPAFDRFLNEVRRGKRVFFYNGSAGASPESPFWGWYGREWVKGGDPGYYAHEAPIWKHQPEKRRLGNWTYACVNSKSYFESKLWGVHWYLNLYPEIKDLYFDLANPNLGGCYSAVHGCRWTDDFGRTMPGRNMSATREYHKRAYRVLKAKNADGALYGHTADVRSPADVFFDMISMGESLAAKVRWQDSYYDIYTPEFMQAMFCPRAVDTVVRTPPQFLRSRECWDPVGFRNYNPHEPKLNHAIRHCIAYIRIHDIVIPRAPHDREGPQFAAVEYPISQLGVGRKYWAYYSAGDVPVTLSQPGPRQLWAYYANDCESILIVLNDTDAAVRQTVSVKGLSAKGVELLDRRTFDFTSGAATIDLPARGAVFIRFKANECSEPRQISSL